MQGSPREVCNLAIAHDDRPAKDRAYDRTGMLEKRRPLMAEWANFCGKLWEPAEVIPFRRKAEGE